MKTTFLLSLFVILLTACSSFEKNTIPTMPVRKISIIEVNGWDPYFEIVGDSIYYEDTDYMSVLGLIEIDKNFNMKITERTGSRGSYQSGKIRASNQIRNMLLNTANSFSTDSINPEEFIHIYDGHFYYIIVEKENGEIIRLEGYPRAASSDIRELSCFLRDSAYIYAKTLIPNQDSIKLFLKEYEKYIADVRSMPPPPVLKKKIPEVKFKTARRYD